MKILAAVFLGLVATSFAISQQVARQLPLRPGAVYGEIVINEVSGNHLGNFTCSNLTASVSQLNGASWKRTATATGSFAGRRCSFRISNVPAGEPFVAVLSAQFPNGCDEKKFETTTSFPMELKSREQLKYAFSVARIRCVLVK